MLTPHRCITRKAAYMSCCPAANQKIYWIFIESEFAAYTYYIPCQAHQIERRAALHKHKNGKTYFYLIIMWRIIKVTSRKSYMRKSVLPARLKWKLLLAYTVIRHICKYKKRSTLQIRYVRYAITFSGRRQARHA